MTVSGFTLMSRVLGLVRDVLLLRVLGAGMISDAFLTGFKFPNLFRRIFGEGAFNAAFVPLFAREIEDNGEVSAREFASVCFSFLLWTLLIGSIISIIGMRWIMAAFTPGFLIPADPNWQFTWEWFWEIVRYPHGTEKFEITVAYSRIMFGYLMCMALSACLSGMLNTLKIFAIPAFAPVILNIIFITTLGIIIPVFGFGADPMMCGKVVSWSVIASGIAQLALLLVTCKRNNMGITFHQPKLTPKTKRLMILMGPGIIAAGIKQVNLLIGQQIASVQDTAITWLYAADRIFQLPLGMIGIAFGVVLLPQITRLVRQGDESRVTSSLQDGISFSMLITLPAMIAMMIIPQSIMRVLFENGDSFLASDTSAAAAALAGFSVGLPAYILIKVLQPAYFAREDTKRPMIIAAITVIVNIIGSLILFPIFKHVGIAIATSIAGWVNLILLYWGIRKSLSISRPLVTKLSKTLLASLIMGAALLFIQNVLSSYLTGSMFWKIVSLGLLISTGLLVYIISALGVKATSLKELKSGFRK